MNAIDITLYLNAYRVRALADALGERTAETVEDKLTEAFDMLYQEYVPDEQRVTIEAKIEQEDAAERARLEAAIRFKPCLFCGVLPFDFCFDSRTLLIGNIFLIQCVERLSQFILDCFGGLIAESICQCPHTVCVQIQCNINVVHWRSPRLLP